MVEGVPSNSHGLPITHILQKIGGAWAWDGLLAPTQVPILGLPQFLQRQYLQVVVQLLAFKAPGSGQILCFGSPDPHYFSPLQRREIVAGGRRVWKLKPLRSGTVLLLVGLQSKLCRGSNY